MTPSAELPARPRVLIAGAGFIGRAVAEDLAARDRVELRLVSRRPPARAGAAIAAVAADLNRRADRLRALEGVDVALWLVHSLDRPDYADRDPALAAAFARDAAAAGVKRIVYLGALGPDDEAAPHTASRHATGRALASAGVPTVELRASVVIGRGSAVIEMVRALALRLPVLIVPAGAQALTQPVALGDATAALAEAALGPARPGIWALAGDDVVPWSALLTLSADLLGRALPQLRMPFATPRLSSLTLAALTPLSRTMSEALVRGLGRPAIVTDPRRRWPAPAWISLREALAAALGPGSDPKDSQ
ncbi:MAG: NAD(P)H-binding protein [Nannocystis sp.]|nr:NAD(P)H-binding protein [Nannocystis sp.]